MNGQLRVEPLIRVLPLAGMVLVGSSTLGCSSDPAQRQPDNAENIDDFADAGALQYRPCPKAQNVGQFKVELAENYTAVSGSVADGVVPVDVPELIEEHGPCRIERRKRLTCNPGCGAGMTCGEGGNCITYPNNISVGTVKISGLLKPVSMDPHPTGTRYWDTSLPHPGFSPDAAIRLRTGGGKLQPFALRGVGVTPLQTSQEHLVLRGSEEFRVTWDAAPASATRVKLTINIDQHGQTPLSATCEVEDTGAAVVPLAIVKALFAAGPSGYPNVQLVRQSADSVSVAPGCVEFLVTAGAKLNVSVEGHFPCKTTSDCPAGKSCIDELQTCK